MATVTWVATAPGNWSNTANWSSANVPQAGDDVVFDGSQSGFNCTIDVTTNALKSFTVLVNYDGLITFSGGFTLLLNQATTAFAMYGGQMDLKGGVIKVYITNVNSFTAGNRIFTSTGTGFIWVLNGTTNATFNQTNTIFPNIQLGMDGTGLSTITLSSPIISNGYISIVGSATVSQAHFNTGGFDLTCQTLNVGATGAGTATLDLTGGGTVYCSNLITVGGSTIAGTITCGASPINAGNITVGANGTINGSTGVIIVNGNFTMNGVTGTFNANGTRVKMYNGAFDSSAGVASWNAAGFGTLEFVSGRCTLNSPAYNINTQNPHFFIVDTGCVLTLLADVAVNGVSPSITVNGVLDLGGHLIRAYDYTNSPNITGPIGNGTIKNGNYTQEWGNQTMLYSIPTGLTMNCNFTFNGINPFSSPVVFTLMNDFIITGDCVVQSSSFGAGVWNTTATFNTNGFKFICNNLTMIDQGNSTISLFCTFDFSNSIVIVKGNLQVGTNGQGTFTVLKTNNSQITLSGTLASNTTGQAWPQGIGTLMFQLNSPQSVIAQTAGASLVLPNILINGSSTLSFTSNFSTLSVFTQAPNQITVTNGVTWTLPNGDALVGEIDFPLILRSSVPGSQWNLVGTSVASATSKLVNVDIKDANATSGIVIYAFTSIDSGNNLNINFRKSGLGQVGTAFNLVDLIGNALVTNSETLSVSSAKTANATYTADLSVYRSGSFICDVTAWVGGTTPTIQFIVEALDSNSGKWVPIATPAAGAVSAVETVVVVMDETTSVMPTVSGFRYAQAHPLMGIGPGQNYRVRTVITGAPTSVTFSISFLGRPV